MYKLSLRMQAGRKRVEEYCQTNTTQQDQENFEIPESFDGTWSKRGYTANYGIGFVISVDTGEF